MRCHRFALCALLMLASPVALRALEPEADESPVAESNITESNVTAASFAKEEAADTAPCDLGCGCEDDCCCRRFYVSAITGVSFMNGQSGGFNEEGPHDNTGNANDNLVLAGGAFGVAIPREYGTLRLEFEARGRNEFNGITDSFAPPVPTFFYDVTARDGWSTMVNAWFDVQVRHNLAVYGGGGVGAAGYKLSVNDTIVEGAGSTADLAWQLGVGVIYQVNDRIELDFGYRYTDLGNGNIALSQIGTNNDDGNYQLALTSSDLLLQLRIYEPLSFLRR